MTKRIKITDPKDLREGMRVEVVSEKLGIVQGVLYKPSGNPLREILCLTYKGKVGIHKAVIRGDYGSLIDEEMIIHRLIDGIEDVVVGDILKDFDGDFTKVLDVRGQLVDLSHYAGNITDEALNRHYSAKSIFEIKDLGHTVLIDKHKSKKTELTQTEAKEIIAEQKGVEPEDIVIKKDE